MLGKIWEIAKVNVAVLPFSVLTCNVLKRSHSCPYNEKNLDKLKDQWLSEKIRELKSQDDMSLQNLERQQYPQQEIKPKNYLPGVKAAKNYKV